MVLGAMVGESGVEVDGTDAERRLALRSAGVCFAVLARRDELVGLAISRGLVFFAAAGVAAFTAVLGWVAVVLAAAVRLGEERGTAFVAVGFRDVAVFAAVV